MLDKNLTELVFELVIYVGDRNKTVEWTCGWGHIPILNADSKQNKMKVKLHAGSPGNCSDIECGEVGKKSGMIAGVKSLFKGSSANDNKSELTVTLTPASQMQEY